MKLGKYNLLFYLYYIINFIKYFLENNLQLMLPKQKFLISNPVILKPNKLLVKQIKMIKRKKIKIKRKKKRKKKKNF